MAQIGNTVVVVITLDPRLPFPDFPGPATTQKKSTRVLNDFPSWRLQ